MMFQDDSLTPLSDDGEKKPKKRKLHKHKKRRVKTGANLLSDDSDTETSAKKTPAGLDLKFSLSQSSQTFSEIFSQAQATLREHPSKKKGKKYNQSELPVIHWTLSETEAKQLRQNRKKPKSAKKKKKKEDHELLPVSPSLGTLGDDAILETTRVEGQQLPIGPYHLAVADLDTDTELDHVGPETLRPNLVTESQIEEIVISSSEEETPVLNNRCADLNFRRRPLRSRRSWSPISVVTLSSRSSSPSLLPEVISDFPLPDPSNDVKPDISYHVGDMRIRIMYRGDLHEFDGNADWDVEKVREKLSELTDVPESELLIYTENELKMEDGKTLKDYNIKLGEILEGLRRCTENHIPHGEGVIKLKFQKEGLKRPIHLSVLKYRNLKEVRSQVAKLIQAEEKKLFFRVDGEVVDLLKTPDDLELEDDFCVDIFEKN